MMLFHMLTLFTTYVATEPVFTFILFRGMHSTVHFVSKILRVTYCLKVELSQNISNFYVNTFPILPNLNYKEQVSSHLRKKNKKPKKP